MIMKSPLRARRGTGEPQVEQNAALKTVSGDKWYNVMSCSPDSQRTEPDGAKRLAALDDPVIFWQRRQ